MLSSLGNSPQRINQKKSKLVCSSCAYTAVITSEDNIRRTSVFVLLMLVLMFMSLLSSLANAHVCVYVYVTGSENQP